MKYVGEKNDGDERYQDQFYQDMTEYYEHHNTKHDSPTKRLVKQKEATLKVKTNNPEYKDT